MALKTLLEDMLRDHLVCGCKDKRLQCKLLAEKDLTFQQALTIAKATEAAEKEVRDLQQPATAQLNAVHGGKKPPPKSTRELPGMACYRCEGKHKATDCKYQDAECHFSKKKGHISRV